jgi:hypothetical protein
MSKQQFKVGDRVIVTTNICGIRCAGMTGTIIQDFFSPEGTNGRYVRLDRPVESVTWRRDWVWAFNFQLKHIHKHPVIVITTDGKTTTATEREGKKVIKTATAKCSDKDTFDFAEGARVAFERLQGRDPFPNEKKPKYYNGKVVCVKSGFSWWTVGKIYDVRNGRIKANDGDVFPRPTQEPYKDAEDVHFAGCDMSSGDGRHNLLNEFIPLVED